MSNDLIELTTTELDAVSAGKHHPSELLSIGPFAPIITQVNVNDQTAAVVGSGSVTQSNGNNNTISGNMFPTTLTGLTFSGMFSV
jgi:hypothetical protein